MSPPFAQACETVLHRRPLAEEPGLEVRHGLLLEAGQDVAVDLEGEGRRRVAQAFLHDLRMDALLEEQGRV